MLENWRDFQPDSRLEREEIDPIHHLARARALVLTRVVCVALLLVLWFLFLWNDQTIDWKNPVLVLVLALVPHALALILGCVLMVCWNDSKTMARRMWRIDLIGHSILLALVLVLVIALVQMMVTYPPVD